MGGCCIGDCCVIDIPGAIEKIKDFFCSDSCCVGYHPQRSDNGAHAKKIADELAEMKERKHKIWNANEQTILDVVNKGTALLLAQLAEINQKKFGGVPLNIDLDGIKARSGELNKKVVGFVGRFFDDRLVLTDKELSVILAELDDEKRAKNFEAFCEKLQQTAVQGLKTAISDTVKEQNALITSCISSRLEEVNKTIRRETEEYEKLLSVKKKSEREAMQLQMDHIYTYGLCDIVLDQLR